MSKSMKESCPCLNGQPSKNWDKRVQMTIVKPFLFTLICLSVLCGKPTWGFASVTMDYTLGFSNHFRLNTWLPVTITLDNRGTNIQGELEINVLSGSEYDRNVFNTRYTAPVELPKFSKKLYSFTILIQSFSHPFTIKLTDNQTSLPLLEETIDLRPYFTEKPLMVFVGNDVSIDLFKGDAISQLPIITQPTLLPESSLGYDGVSLMVMPAKAFQQLREPQYKGLNEWIEQGGHLVIAGDANYRALLEDRVQRLIPIAISGLQQVETLKALEAMTDSPLVAKDPFLILKAQVPDSQTLLAESDTPLIFQKKLGVGSIEFLVFNHQKSPFVQWKGRHAFWKQVLSFSSTEAREDVRGIQHKVFSNLATHLPAFYKNIYWAVGFLFLYLFSLSGLIYLYLKKTRFAWLTFREETFRGAMLGGIVGTAVVFSIASYFVFYTPTLNNIHSNQISYLRYSGQDLIAWRSTFVGSFSLYDDDFVLDFGNKVQSIVPVELEGWTQPNPPVLHMKNHGAKQILKIHHKRWSHRFLRIDTPLDFPFYVKATLATTGDQEVVHLNLENRSPYAIVGGYLYFAGHLIELENFESDSKIIKQFPISSETDFRKALEYRVSDALDQYFIVRAHDKYKDNQGVLHIFGNLRGLPAINQTAPPTTQPVFLEWKVPVDTNPSVAFNGYKHFFDDTKAL